MRRIGKTESGEVIVAVSPSDIVRIGGAAKELVEELRVIIGFGDGDKADKPEIVTAYRRKPRSKYPLEKDKVCPVCKKTFQQTRCDQSCCSRACRAKLPRNTYPKYDAAAAKAARLARLKELNKARPIDKRDTFKLREETEPAEFTQARREAAQE